MECSICAEVCTKPISCPYCPTNNTICKKCVCANIINNVAVPMCIFCKTAWTTSDIVSKLGYKFLNTEIRDAETQLLLSREDNTINKAFASADQSRILGNEIKQINQRIKDIKVELKNLQKQKMQLKNKVLSLNVANFTHSCPIIGCKGFIHNTDNYCNTCNSSVCSKCLEIMMKMVGGDETGVTSKSLIKNNSNGKNVANNNFKGKEREFLINGLKSDKKDANNSPKDDKEETVNNSPKDNKKETVNNSPKGDKEETVNNSPKGKEKENLNNSPKGDKKEAVNNTPKGKEKEKKEIVNNSFKGKKREMTTNTNSAHTCSASNLNTVKLLEDSKKCPNCDVKIYKISGCSQMFCTMCYTAFDWTTLKIIKSNIHNPHYFEVANNMVTCKNIVSIKISSLMHPLISYDEYLNNSIIAMYLLLQNIQPIIDNLRIRCNNRKTIEETRHKYGSGDIDRETFGDKLYIAERKRNINVLLIQSLEILNDIVTTCLNKLNINLDRCVSILSVKNIENINLAKRSLNNDDREVINDYKKKIKGVVKKSHSMIVDIYNKLKEEYDARGLNIPRKSDLFSVYLEKSGGLT